MTDDAKSRIQDLCAQALAATRLEEIEPILAGLRAALHDKLQQEESWMSLCEKAAVEKDPKKLLHLVSEINRRFRSQGGRSSAPNKNGKNQPPDGSSNASREG
jgi:hypothetical protein